MKRGLALPGWGRSHYRFALVVTLGTAVFLRISYHESVVEGDLFTRHLPVAAAIGLHPEVPRDAALSTWINSGLYSLVFDGLSLAYPGLSSVDVGVAFLQDPQTFSAPARLASMAAVAVSIYLTFLLISTLVDRPTAVAVAFVLAVHPAAVAFTSGVDSAAFCLLFLLCGLLIAARTNWCEARPVDFAAIGLSLGFAGEAIPYTAIIFCLVLIVAIRHTPGALRADLAAKVAISVAFFCVAASLIVPSISSTPAVARAMAAGAMVAGGLIIVLYTLRSLRTVLGAETYSAAVLSMGLAVGLIASLMLADGARGVSDTPSSLASRWVVEHLPRDTVIVVHSSLAQSVSLPRNARSWRREFGNSHSHRVQVTLDHLAAIHEAAQTTRPLFDVIPSVCDRSLENLVDDPERGLAVDYILLPEGTAPGVLGNLDGVWLVARFRSSDPDAPGVVIWGTQASPHATPVHVESTIDSHVLSAVPSPAS